MVKSLLSNQTINILEKSLQAASLRHQVISNNIANVNTPGFKRSEVQFEDLLQQAMNEGKLPLARTHNRHLPVFNNGRLSLSVSTESNTSLRSDGNNVDIDAEMASLAKNSIYYQAVAQQISRYFSNLKSAINEGRR